MIWLSRLWRNRSRLAGIWPCGGILASRHWGLGVMAYPVTAQLKDQGKNWTWKMILLLWNFADAMWEHRNTILHNHELGASRTIRDADINDVITKPYFLPTLRPTMWQTSGTLTCHWLYTSRSHLDPVDGGSLMQNCWLPSHIPESILAKCH
jgi:hypothetical protein